MNQDRFVPDGMDYWQDQDGEFPFVYWKYAVENGETRLGYWEWVFRQKEAQAESYKAGNAYAQHPHRSA